MNIRQSIMRQIKKVLSCTIHRYSGFFIQSQPKFRSTSAHTNKINWYKNKKMRDSGNNNQFNEFHYIEWNLRKFVPMERWSRSSYRRKYDPSTTWIYERRNQSTKIPHCTEWRSTSTSAFYPNMSGRVQPTSCPPKKPKEEYYLQSK